MTGRERRKNIGTRTKRARVSAKRERERKNRPRRRKQLIEIENWRFPSLRLSVIPCFSSETVTAVSCWCRRFDSFSIRVNAAQPLGSGSNPSSRSLAHTVPSLPALLHHTYVSLRFSIRHVSLTSLLEVLPAFFSPVEEGRTVELTELSGSSDCILGLQRCAESQPCFRKVPLSLSHCLRDAARSPSTAPCQCALPRRTTGCPGRQKRRRSCGGKYAEHACTVSTTLASALSASWMIEMTDRSLLL